MAATRKKRGNFINSRRRTQDEGDEEGSIQDIGDESQTDESVLSADENDDVDNSDFSEPENQDGLEQKKAKDTVNGNGDTKTSRNRSRRKRSTNSVPDPPKSTAFKNTADMEDMMNGLKIDDGKVREGVEFEDSMKTEPSASRDQDQDGAVPTKPTPYNEHKNNDRSHPSAVPTRGVFFMHDHRGAARDQLNNGIPVRARTKGRSVAAPAYNVKKLHAPNPEVELERWDHDLHDSVVDTSRVEPVGPKANASIGRLNPLVGQAVSLSKSIPLGTVAVRILLPDMKEAITIDKKMTVKQHTRLPDLRPPLRRDKPVRISLPDRAATYQFPIIERSFIFIPRAQRPNQQTARNRNRGYLSHGGSRRTSVFGGSNYSPSVAMSRRSSQARDGFISPTGSVFSRPPGGIPQGATRPVVKLPVGAQGHPTASPMAIQVSNSGTPLVNLPQGLAYPLPSQPTYREHRSSQMTMHQPRPQKHVSVATIESPGAPSYHAPQQQVQQPFHHQVPYHVGEQQPLHTPSQSQSSQAGYGPSQMATGTPLQNVPKDAINAQPFQPATQPPPQPYYPYSPQYMYYPSVPPPTGDQQGPYGAPQMSSPIYMQQPAYYMPVMMPIQQGLGDDQQSLSAQQMYAQENNGTVYFFDPSQLMNNGSTGHAPNGYPGEGASNGMVPMIPETYGFVPQDPNVVYYPMQ